MRDNIMVSLPSGLNAELASMAKELGESKSALVRQALDYYFDVLDLKIAESRAKNKQKGKSLDELIKLSDEL
ncbi:ribbon-helix-helix protein, CopG family [Campylobacter sp. MOP7]|uniref:ribbon-helix-helix protein, CopG family n=1 Tax=Campylobacter canis TaxID=3378588 RepID=UPI00387EC85F